MTEGLECTLNISSLFIRPNCEKKIRYKYKRDGILIFRVHLKFYEMGSKFV